MCKRGEESRIYEIFASSTVKDGILPSETPKCNAVPACLHIKTSQHRSVTGHFYRNGLQNSPVANSGRIGYTPDNTENSGYL